MDGIFKIVSTLFQQLYIIQFILQQEQKENAKILPLVYALVASKTDEIFTHLFDSLNDFLAENELDLKPQFI